MRKFIPITILVSLSLLAGCTGGYTLDTAVSPSLDVTNLMDSTDFFNAGFKMTDELSQEAADNLAAHL